MDFVFSTIITRLIVVVVILTIAGLGVLPILGVAIVLFVSDWFTVGAGINAVLEDDVLYAKLKESIKK